MESWKQLGSGFLLGVLSIGLVLGGFALAMAEGGLIPSLAPQPSPTTSPEVAYPTLELLSETEEPTATIAPATPTPNLAIAATATNTCIYPQGWVGILVQASDTLNTIALKYQIGVEDLKSANCLSEDAPALTAGALLYVPVQPVATVAVCVPRADWPLLYIVQPGDTLYRLSLLYRISVYDLKQANCLFSNTIFPGQRLRVPNVATSTATFTPVVPPTMTATETPSLSPTSTVEGEISATPTNEITVTPVETSESPTPTPSCST